MTIKKPKNADELAKIIAKESLADEEYLIKSKSKIDKLEKNLNIKTDKLEAGLTKTEKDLDTSEAAASAKLDVSNVSFADDVTKDEDESE